MAFDPRADCLVVSCAREVVYRYVISDKEGRSCSLVSLKQRTACYHAEIGDQDAIPSRIVVKVEDASQIANGDVDTRLFTRFTYRSCAR